MPTNDQNYQKQYNKEYYLKNKDKIKEQTKQYHDEHIDKHKEYMNNYYQINKIKMNKKAKEYRDKTKRERSEYQKKYREENKDKLKQQRQQYQVENKDVIAQRRKTLRYKFNHAKTSAKQRNMEFLLTFDEYCVIIDDLNCHYCNNQISNGGSSLDRKNNERYYSIENSVICCRRCNVTFSDFYNYEEKLLLAETIKTIDNQRKTADATVVSGSVTLS